MKAFVLIAFLVGFSGNVFADSFETIVNGRSYTCTSHDQSSSGSSCSARGASANPACNNTPPATAWCKEH